MADQVFSGEGANPAYDYKVWKKWAEAKLIVDTRPREKLGPLLFTLLIGVAAKALEQVTLKELGVDGGENKLFAVLDAMYLERDGGAVDASPAHGSVAHGSSGSPGAPLQLAVPGSRAAGCKRTLPEWPRVTCSSCDTVAKWKDMRSEKVYENFQEKMSDTDDVYYWVYTCKKCVSRQMDCSEKLALADIKSAHVQHMRVRNVKFKAALQDRQQKFTGMSRRGLRTLVQEDLLKVIEPLMEFVARKLAQLAKRKQGIEAYDQLLEALKIAPDKIMELSIIEELEKWEHELEKLSRPLAFADKEDATKMFAVAQCSDEWVQTASGALRAWYICLQDCKGTQPPCGTLIPSKTWKRRYEDMSASKQKWYCVCCETRYRTKYGMLVEVHAKGLSTFMLAEVSNKDVEDVRAMYLDKTLTPKDYKDLWEKIPGNIQPMDPAAILRPVRQSELKITEGVDEGTVSKILDVESLKNLPRWNWDQLFSLLGEKG